MGSTSYDQSKIAFVDWLAFSFRLSPQIDPIEYIQDQLEKVFNLPNISMELSSRGWYGYQNRIDLDRYGILAYGGESQQGTYHIELNGQACALIQDWNRVRRWGESVRARITRTDLAHDDYKAETISIQKAIEWYENGGFTSNGRPPKRHLHYDFESGEGQTFQIGQRKNGKYCRVYEKGKEQGDPNSAWVRVEVELRNKSREIPWNVITETGQFLAGAYPCLEYLSESQYRIKTIQKSASITYQQMVSWLRMAGGKALGVMLQVHEGDAASVLSEVVRKGVPRRLEPFDDFKIVELVEDAT